MDIVGHDGACYIFLKLRYRNISKLNYDILHYVTI